MRFNLLRRHFLALGVSVAIGFLMLFPHLWLREDLGSAYRGIPLMGSDAETHYFSQIASAARGSGLGNPYIREGADLPTGFNAPIHAFLSIPLALGAPFVFVDLAYKAVFPALCFLFLYALLYTITQDRLWSVACGALVILGYHLFQSQDMINLVKGFPMTTEFTRYARPVNPQVSSLFTFGVFGLLYAFIRKADVRFAILLACILGASFYSYLFLWLFLCVAFAVFILVFLFLKDGARARLLSGSFLGGLTLGIPAHLGLLEYLRSPLRDMLPHDLVPQASHVPNLSILGIGAVVVYAIFWKRMEKPERVFFGGLIAAAFLVVSQNIVTGVVLQPGHFHWYYGMPVFILFISFVFQRISILWRPFFAVVVPLALVAASFGLGLHAQYTSYVYNQDSIRAVQEYMPVFEWLEENTPSGSVVLGNQSFSDYLPIFTSNYGVWSSYAGLYLLDPARREWRPDTILGSNFDARSRAFALDYLVWDRTENPLWATGFGTSLVPVFETKRFALFELKK